LTPERWLRVKDLFEEACTLDNVAQRLFLNDVCGNDGELRAEVASLLSAHSTAEAILDRSAVEYLPQGAFDAPLQDWQGRRMGAYELIACLGRGGMGEVWRARRADTQYEKEVAIKLVRAGYDTAFVLQRFKAERQILASLEHPNIARLIDGGMTQEGQPYLVMELVEGRPIDEYCETHNLAIAERLRLFREVCGAVSYAHQHLVVHRDLKPANILVTAEGSIKLLDFGIAKLLQAPAADGTPTDVTRTTMRALTPAFSSPEQILGLNITTASDVYSLGVVLFHLLAGRGPYRTNLASTRDAIRDVCETEPLKPSAAATQAAAINKTRALPDTELDDITLKALRKEPEKRYGSVEQLSEDLRRYLAGLPIIAHGGQFSYRAGKFLRRHRIEMAAAGVVAAALLVGMVAAMYEARIANEQRARAERHFASVRALANTFMFQMDESIRDLPGATGARALLVQTALTYLDTLSKESGGDRALQLELAQAYDKVGDVQGQNNAPNIGHAPAAVDSYEKAIALAAPLTAADPANSPARTLLAVDHLKHSRALLTMNGNARVATDESQQGVTILEQLAANNDPKALLRLSVAYGYHAWHLGWSGRGEEAISTVNKAVGILEALHRAAPNDPNIDFRLANVYGDAATILQTRGTQAAVVEQALALLHKALALEQHALSTAPEHALPFWRSFAASHINIGIELYQSGDYAGSLRELGAGQEALAKTQVDPNNFQARLDTAKTMHHVARALLASGRTEDAAATFAQTLDRLNALAEQGVNFEVFYLLATCNLGMGLIEVKRIAGAADRSVPARLQHWRAARDWFAASVPQYQRVLKGITLPPQEAAGYDQAQAGLANSNAEIARLETQAPAPAPQPSR
jgi:tetratricopeptide (TPR) repeat protein/tRNA A-37 threonylcarbamoyl transferase component Bud32